MAGQMRAGIIIATDSNLAKYRPITQSKDDEYTVALDYAASVAAIAVHNKGSMAGCVMIIPIWRSDAKYYALR